VRGYVIGAAIDGAINALTRSLALEFGPAGIRVNAIAPGAVETPLWDRLHGDAEARRAYYARRLPVGRVGTPEEGASAAVFLMTNGFVTGQVIWLEGGAEAME
jgi:NAD(P)-dependent dehydrogenase (short-subunit alcohol dehydrogenase family)